MGESIDVSEFVANVFKGIGEEFQPIVLEERECIYECDCSKKRFEKALLATGKKSLDELADSKEDIETVCHFCGKKYYFTPEDIKKIRENAFSRTSRRLSAFSRANFSMSVERDVIRLSRVVA